MRDRRSMRQDYFYTTSPNEVSSAESSGYVTEEMPCFVYGGAQSAIVPLYRLYRQATGHHFYTASKSEADSAVVSSGYKSEGVACYVFDAGAAPNTLPVGTTRLYRLYNPSIDDHFYTTSQSEANNAVKVAGYRMEGPACYVFDPQANIQSLPNGVKPLNRIYNPAINAHFYTASQNEASNAIANAGYKSEGIACYVYDSVQATAVPLYRLYHQAKGHHFYTASLNEADKAVATDGYTSEGIACYVYDPGTSLNALPKGAVPLLRLYNPVADHHFYTTSQDEANGFAKNQYVPEGTACLVLGENVSGTVKLYRLHFIQEVKRIEVFPPTLSLTVPQTYVFQATVTDQVNNPIEGAPIYWKCSDNKVGSLSVQNANTNNEGKTTTIFTAANPGSTMLSADYPNVSGTAQITVAPSQQQSGYSQLQVQNCDQSKRTVDIWLYDHADGWSKKGSVEAQYDQYGNCPAAGTLPTAIELEDGHVYDIHIVDSACPNSNPQTILNCQVCNPLTGIVGNKAGGAYLVRVGF